MVGGYLIVDLGKRWQLLISENTAHGVWTLNLLSNLVQYHSLFKQR